MKNKRYLLLVVLPLISLGVCVVVVVRSSLPTRFTQLQCDRIQIGMTEDQVERVMGVPAGYHAKEPPRVYGPLAFDFTPEGRTVSNTQQTQKCWGGDEGIVVVVFDKQGKVTQKMYHDAIIDHESKAGQMLRKARNWLP
jgi:outer membrane protein assembly factor BamE (lipoprotein component of BamABCDE complex)